MPWRSLTARLSQLLHPKPAAQLTLGTYGLSLFQRKFVLGPTEIATHKHVIGVTGQGKSKLLASMFVQLMNQGVGCALIDPHADLAADVLGILLQDGYFERNDAYQRLLYIDFSNANRFLPFNVLNQPYDPHTIARNIVEACKRAWPALADGSAPQFENILLAGALTLVQNDRPLTDLPRLLTDTDYRNDLLAHVTDETVVDFFHNRFDKWGRDSASMIESTLRRVFLLSFSPALRYSLGQERNLLNLRQLMDEGVSILFNLGGLDEDTQKLLGCLITVNFEVAALSRTDTPEESRSHYHLLLDEFSMFSAQSEESLARVLSLCRKFHLFLTLSHQSWAQVNERLRGALQNSVEIAFRLGRSDAQLTAPHFAKFDPHLIKHEVEDLDQAERSHPIFYSIQEQLEGWSQTLSDLKPREAFVKTRDKSAKIRTLEVRPLKGSRQRLEQIIEQYAKRLLVPLSQAIPSTSPREPLPQIPLSPSTPLPVLWPKSQRHSVRVELLTHSPESPASLWITTQFPSRCKTCGTWIRRGARALYDARERRLTCEICSHQP